LTIDGRRRSVTDIGNPAAVEIEHGDRFQNVVELGGGKRNRNILRVTHAPHMLEVADSVLVKDDALAGRLLALSGLLAFRG
jgi:hypothetical protein